MQRLSAEVVICGAGIAGISAAYHLTLHRPSPSVFLVDARPPLTLTSDKSTECYRDWWPDDEALTQLMDRSITLLEELSAATGNRFRMNRKGYLYLTANRNRAEEWEQEGERKAGRGAFRVHRHLVDSGYDPSPSQDGADLILSPQLLRTHFPYLSSTIVAALHVRRAGWLDAQQLGMLLLERAQGQGVRLIHGEANGVAMTNRRVKAVEIRCKDSTLTVETPVFVNAAGPFFNDVNKLLRVEVPVYCERHLKVAFQDPERVYPEGAPLLIGADPVTLSWSAEEQRLLEEAESEDLHRLLEPLPPGVHARTESPGRFLGLWGYDTTPVAPSFPLPIDPHYPEVVLRGLATLLPALSVYLGKMPKPFEDGGYYTKTPENRLLCGPLPEVEGAYALGALSGYGIMAAHGAGELLASHVLGRPLPAYARAFDPCRYRDPRYLGWVKSKRDTSQL